MAKQRKILLILFLCLIFLSQPIHGLGQWGTDSEDDPADPQETEEELIPEDELIELEEESTVEPDIEIDEDLPINIRRLKQVEPFLQGDLASRDISEGDELITENDRLKLYFNEESLAIKVERIDSGYIWSSALDSEEMEGVSGFWRAFMRAPIVIDYLEPGNPSATWRDFPLLEEVTVQDDGVDLLLNFPRISVELVFKLRLEEDALSVEIPDSSIRYLSVSEELQEQTAQAREDLEIETEVPVEPGDEADIAPDDPVAIDPPDDLAEVTESPLGDISDDVVSDDSSGEDVDQWIVDEADEGITTDIETIDPEQEGTGRSDDNPYIITKMQIMPFFGAVEAEETEGYIFLPDGPGAVMRFAAARRYANNFSKRVYGIDRAVIRPAYSLTRLPRVDEPQIHMPVFGISHGQKQEAFLAVIESGQDYADITATPAGVRTNFFWASAVFNYNEPFFQRTGRGGEGFRYVRREVNTVNPQMRYHLLGDEQADYVGMAVAYRDYLDATDRLPDTDFNALPLLIQAYMADLQQGLLMYGTSIMTRAEDVIDWLPELHAIAGNNLSLTLMGAQRGGISGHKLGDMRLSPRLGNSRTWNDLKAMTQDLHIPLILHTEISRGYDPQLSRQEMVYNIDRSIAHESTQDFLFDERYYLNFTSQAELMERFMKDAPGMDYSGMDPGSLGSVLISDYKDGIQQGRHDIRRKISEMADRADGFPLYLQAPNDYLWSSASAAYDLPMQHTQYLYEHDVVPFFQIVLSGRIPLYGQPMNFGAAEELDLLQRMDYGLAPSFLLTQEPPSNLRHANRQDIYFSEYSALLPFIEESYDEISSVMGPVQGQSMIARDIPETNLSVTLYEEGARVVVNYSDQELSYGGQAVPPLSAILIEADDYVADVDPGDAEDKTQDEAPDKDLVETASEETEAEATTSKEEATDSTVESRDS